MFVNPKSGLRILGAILVMGGAATAAPAKSAAPNLDAEFRAAYPGSAPSSATQLAGVRLAKLVIPGLQISARSEDAPADGGVVLSLADGAGVVRVLVHLAVAADAPAARKVLDAELHGVATQLHKADDATLGDLAWADDAGKGTWLVIATQANIAYSVRVNDAAPPAVPTAAAIAGLVRRSMVIGAPAFPAATVTLPSTLDAKTGGAVRVTVPGGYPYKVHADGGYMASGAQGSVVLPFGPGPVTIYATVVDELARVTVATGTTLAQ